MFFIEKYVHKIISYDLINTFFYKDLIEIPKLKKIILNFGYRKSNFKYLVSSLLALEFLTSKKGKITTSKRLNIFLKIKKGNPVGCKIILKKNTMYLFYLKLLISILLLILLFIFLYFVINVNLLQLSTVVGEAIFFLLKKFRIVYVTSFDGPDYKEGEFLARLDRLRAHGYVSLNLS